VPTRRAPEPKKSILDVCGSLRSFQATILPGSIAIILDSGRKSARFEALHEISGLGAFGLSSKEEIRQIRLDRKPFSGWL
jgi:hypothetical protein